MISRQLHDAVPAPATLVSLSRSGMAGLAMARLTTRFERILAPVVLPDVAHVRATRTPVAAAKKIAAPTSVGTASQSSALTRA